MEATIYLLLGSNEGDRMLLLKTAVDLLADGLACGALRCSSIYETAAWGKEVAPFLNVAIELNTRHSPEDVLAQTRGIEQLLGRQRTELWGQRTLDIDILFYGDEVIATPELDIPHPQIQNRRFALVPMAELAPQLMHPVLRCKMGDLLERCSDTLTVTNVGHLPTGAALPL